METYHLFKEQVGCLGSVIGFVTSYEVGHLGEPVHHYKNGILVVYLGQAQHKVHRNIYPRVVRNR